MTASRAESSFFGRILTRRHLLTRRAFLAAVLLCPAPLLLGYQWLSSRTASTLADDSRFTSAADEGEASKVRYLKVATRPLSTAGPEFITNEFTGVVVARRSSRLASKAVGRVDSISVDLGDSVVLGQLLIELDHAELDAARGVAEATLASAKSRMQELERGPRMQDIDQAQARVTELMAALALQRANHERKMQLRQSGAISRQELDESQFSLDASLAQLDAAQQGLDLLIEGTREEHLEIQRATIAGLESQLARIAADLADRRITAPFAGQIKQRFLDEGSIVAPGQSLLEIVESAPYEIRVGLPDEMAMNLVDSEIVVFSGSQKLTATIERVSPTIDEATRAREIVLRLSESSSELVSLGSAVKVVVQRRSTEAGLWVPTQSLTSGARGLWAVYLAMPYESSAGPDSAAESTTDINSGMHIIERRQVELLRSHGDWSQIQGPLSRDELLVTEGVHRVTPGQIVESELKPHPIVANQE